MYFLQYVESILIFEKTKFYNAVLLYFRLKGLRNIELRITKAFFAEPFALKKKKKKKNMCTHPLV